MTADPNELNCQAEIPVYDTMGLAVCSRALLAWWSNEPNGLFNVREEIAIS